MLLLNRSIFPTADTIGDVILLLPISSLRRFPIPLMLLNNSHILPEQGDDVKVKKLPPQRMLHLWAGCYQSASLPQQGHNPDKHRPVIVSFFGDGTLTVTKKR